MRVLIADDDPLARDLIRNVLQSQPDIEIAGEAEDGTEAIAAVRRLKPDVLLLDLLMPQMPGMDTLRELASAEVPVTVVVLCAAIGKRQIVEALQLGARGILLKKSVKRLIESIDAVTSGFYWVEDRKLSDVAQVVRSLTSGQAEPGAAGKYNLTAREMQVISLVSLANTNREIATTLSISEDTVKRHLSNIFDKVGMSSRVELAMFAVERRLVSL